MSVNKRWFSSGLLLTLFLGTTVVADEPFKVGTRVPVRIQLAPTPTEQLRLCHEMYRKLGSIKDEREKWEAILSIMGNLHIIPQRWPKQTEAVLQAYEFQADIGTAHNMPRNAMDALLAALPVSEPTTRHPQIHKRLAEVYETLGDAEKAARHFDEAQRSPHFRQLPPDQAALILQREGLFYSRRIEPRRAMKSFRAAAKVPGVNGMFKAQNLLSSLKETVQLHDDKDRLEAKGEADEVERAIAAARRAPKLSAAEQRNLTTFEAELRRLRSQYKLY